MEDPTIVEIANKHNKKPSQVILKWMVQEQIVPVVNSTNPVNMQANLDLFGFEIEPDDVKSIWSLDKNMTSTGTSDCIG